MGLIDGIHHICIKCCNQEEYSKVIDFYGGVLGLNVKRTWATGMMFDIGNGLLEVFSNADSQLEQGTIRHFAFAVKDVDACVKAVEDAGYKVFDGPRDICIPSEIEYPARIAFCYGPIGEEIEFFQEK